MLRHLQVEKWRCCIEAVDVGDHEISIPGPCAQKKVADSLISPPPQEPYYGLSEPFQILLKSHTNAYVRENFDGP